MNNTKDLYESTSQLFKNTKENVDYRIEIENRLSPVSVIAIHSGGIEAGTGEIAREIANIGQYKYYSFNGIRDSESDSPKNLELHVTSHKFLHTPCLELVSNSIATVSIHGADEKNELSFVGGKNFVHANFIKEELRKSGFYVEDNIREGLEGYAVLNICNRNMRNMGVQIEVSQGLRKMLFSENWKLKSNRINPTNEFYIYCKAIWAGTQKYLNIP